MLCGQVLGVRTLLPDQLKIWWLFMSTTSPDERITTYNPAVPTTEFEAQFPIFDNSDLAVYVNDQERTDFTVSALYDQGVSNNARVIMATGVTGKVLIVGDRDPRRQNRFLNGGPIPPRDLNLAFDTIESEMQEARRDISRSVQSEIGEPGYTIDADIPDGRTLAKQGNSLVAGPDIVAIGDEVEAAKNIVEGWASDVISQGNVPIYATVVGMPALEIPDGISAIRVNGYYAAGDGGDALYAKVVSEPGHAGKFRTADGAWWEIASISGANVAAFGAVGDGFVDDSQAIQNAIDFVSAFANGDVTFGPHTYAIGSTLLWKGGVWLRGIRGKTIIKLLNDANCTIIESDGFAVWEAWSSGSIVGYPMEGGLDGLVLEGNAQNQGLVSTTLANLVYGVKILSHRFGIGWLQVRNIKGIGIRTAYNPAIMLSLRQAENVGMFGAREGTPSPYVFDRINVTDCLYEAIVFGGPADISLNHITTNYNGWLGDGPEPTTPRTSLLFPGEEIHGVRFQTAFDLKYLNANAAMYGRGVYIAPFVRATADKIITSSSWGR